MSLRILIVDDEQPARNRLRELLADCHAEVPHDIVGEAANGLEALDMLPLARPDILLVDIHMPGMTGIELAGHVQVLEHPPAVVFTTAHNQYAVEAFEVNAVDYLLKPVRAARLAAALKKVAGGAPLSRETLTRLDPQPRRYFAIAERGRVRLVPVADVLFLKSDLKYVVVRTRDAEHLIEEPLNRLEEEFSGLFIRIHRGCLVARRLIRGFEKAAAADDGEGSEGAGWAVVLEGWPEKLAVSRRQWPAVKAIIKA